MIQKVIHINDDNYEIDDEFWCIPDDTKIFGIVTFIDEGFGEKSEVDFITDDSITRSTTLDKCNKTGRKYPISDILNQFKENILQEVTKWTI